VRESAAQQHDTGSCARRQRRPRSLLGRDVSHAAVCTGVRAAPTARVRHARQLRTTEMAAGDLDKWHKALERALLAFHTGVTAMVACVCVGVCVCVWHVSFGGSGAVHATQRHTTSHSVTQCHTNNQARWLTSTRSSRSCGRRRTAARTLTTYRCGTGSTTHTHRLCRCGKRATWA
jgi:hypothetical protein